MGMGEKGASLFHETILLWVVGVEADRIQARP
jgi:hypothetical protein